MPVLSRRGQLAIAAVLDVALHGRQGPVPARALADRHGLPPRHLEPMLQALVRAGILKGVRGPRGGYGLAADPASISCGRIVRTVMVLAEGEEDGMPTLVSEIVAPAVAHAETLFFDELERVSVSDLYARARGDGLAATFAAAEAT
jgi:Rrf2 family transcriptional regulator, iron-sulfur cluster assembly transcription factor